MYHPYFFGQCISFTPLVPEFAVKDLPSAELQPRFLRLHWRICTWAEHSDDDDDGINFDIHLVSVLGFIVNQKFVFHFRTCHVPILATVSGSLWTSLKLTFQEIFRVIFIFGPLKYSPRPHLAHGRLARWRKWKSCDAGEAKEGLENELWRRWSNWRVGEWVVTYVKQGKGWRMNCDVGEVTESLENQNELWRRWSDWKIGEWAELILILQAFRHFNYVTAHSPTLPSLYLRHNSFSNPSVASPTSQLILQPFFRLSCVTGFSLTLRGEPPMA